jgi:hypothetical protein
MNSILELSHFELVLLQNAMERYLYSIKDSEIPERSFITKDFLMLSIENIINQIKLKIDEQKS